VLHLQKVICRSLNMLADLVSVRGAVKERAQDEHVQRSLKDGGASLCVFRHGRDSTLDAMLMVGIRLSDCQGG
jgi:hypothetical protein